MIKELAKQFNVAESEVKGLVEAGKVGFPEVQKVIQSLTSEGGMFFNLMEEQSKTITGQISNIEDSISTMYNNIGKQSEGVINEALSGVSYLVENYEKIGKVIIELSATYGTYKAVLITITALQKVHSVVLAKAAVEQSLCALAGHKLSDAQAIAVAKTKLLTIAQQGLMKSLKATGAALVANPYVLVAAAIAGLSLAIYKVVTAENEFDKANKRLSNASSDVEKSLSSEVSKLTSLERKLSETKKGTEEYNNIKKTIVDNYGQYYKGLDGEIERVGNLSTVYGHLVEKMRLSIGQRKFESFFKAEQENLDNTIGEKLDKSYDALIEKYGKDKGSKLYQKVFDYAIRGTSMSTETWNQINGATFKEWGFDNSPVGFAIRSVSSLVTEINRATVASGKALDEFKEKYQMTEKDVEYILSGKSSGANDTPIENKTLKQLLIDIDTSKSKIKELQDQANKGLISSDKIKEEQDILAKLTSDYKRRTDKEYGSTKGSNLTSEQSDRLRAIEDYRKSISDAEVQAELDIRQQRIDTMDEGSKKELAMIQLNYDRLRDVNRKRADEMIKERQELERKQWEYDNPKWKEKGMTFKPSTTSVQQLSKPQQGMLLAFDKQTLAARKKAEDDYQKTLMEKYQDYTDKRLAIEKRYNDDLAVLRSERRKAEASGDTGKVEKLDRAIAQGTKDKGKDLMGLDYDQLKESPEYVRAFENLKRTSSETLGSLLSQLENAKRTAAQVLSPDQLREYTTTIQEIMDELDSRNPFQALTDKKEELAAAERGLAEAQAALGKARSDAEAVKGGAKVQSGVRITGFDKNTKQVTSEKEYLSEAQALEKVKTATVNYNKAKDNVTDKNDKVKKSEKEVADQINGLCDSIKGVGEAIGGPAGEIITLIGDIGTFTMTAMSGVKVAADTSAQAISTVEKASVILAVISAAIQVATKIASLFGPRDQEQFDRMRERYESLVKVWDRLIDKKMEYISINTDKEAVKAGEEALDILRKQEAATRKLALARLEVRNGGHSIEYRQWAGSYKFDGRNWKDVAGEIEERTGKAFKSMRDLVDMSAEDLEWIMGSYSGFWSSLDDDFREYLERVMDYKAQAEDIDKTVGEAVTRTSFDGMRDNFLDSLLDMDSSAEDFADNVEKYMRQAILNGMVSKKYEAQLQEWYKGWVEKSADGLTGMEYDELRGAYNDMTRDALRERDNLKEMFGWESEIKDGVSGQLQAAMTEGTASQLVGLWNSTAIDMRELKQLGMEQRDSVRSIMSDVTDILRQNMLIEQNTRRGADNTDGLIGELQGGFRSLDRRLENIERNTKTSYSRG